MILKSLELRNFRNINEVYLEFDRVNVFVGKNGSGKTNILEAIYFLSLGKSFRVYARAEDLIFVNADSFFIKAVLENNSIKKQIEVKYNKDKNFFIKINNKFQRRLSDILGHLYTAVFSADDFYLIKGAPLYRRRFLDNLICQVKPEYYKYLVKFYKVLKQRNAALQTNNPQLIEVWDASLVDIATSIVKERKELILTLSAYISSIYKNIIQQDIILELKYLPSAEPFQFISKLKEKKKEELRIKRTLIGPHRDDVLFYIDNMKLCSFGSGGQLRCAILALKLAEAEYIKEKIKKLPILLLDDITQEFDKLRKYGILTIIKNNIAQIFMTVSTEEEIKYILNNINKVMIFRVEGGRVWRG